MKRLSHKMIIVWHDWSNKANFHILLPVAGPELVVRMDTFGRAAASSSWHSMVPATPRCQWVTTHWPPFLRVPQRLFLPLLRCSIRINLFCGSWTRKGIRSLHKQGKLHALSLLEGYNKLCPPPQIYHWSPWLIGYISWGQKNGLPLQCCLWHALTYARLLATSNKD